MVDWIIPLTLIAAPLAWLAMYCWKEHERAGMWEDLADKLVEELDKHGHGDFHYGPQAQEPRIAQLVAMHRKAKRAQS